MATLDDLKNFIVKRVKDNWDQNKRALLLSDLGTYVNQQFSDAKTLMENGLRRFLTDWPIVQVIFHPEVSQKVGAIPLEVNQPEDLRLLFSGRLGDYVRPEHPPRIYDQSFWNIFVYGVTGRYFIIVNESEQSWRADSNVSTAEHEKSYEIIESDIVSLPRETPMTEKVAAVHRAITTWLEKNGLSRALFERRVARTSSGAEGTFLESNFAAALSKLDSVDLARISMPMDLVKKIFSKHQ